MNPVKVVVSQSELSRFTFLQRAPFHQEQVKLLAVVDNRYYTSMDLGGGGGGGGGGRERREGSREMEREREGRRGVRKGDWRMREKETRRRLRILL